MKKPVYATIYDLGMSNDQASIIRVLTGKGLEGPTIDH